MILALLAVVFWVYSVIDCAVQPPIRHRGVPKPAWVVIVLLLPVIGGILWFALGRVRRRALLTAAPDDDAAFLRRLEEDLARLDHEKTDDDDGPAPRGRV